MKKYTVVIAGSTNHTRICAESLLSDERFEIIGIVTPVPRPVGRKQVITPNPLHQFATEHQIPVVHVDKRIDQSVQNELESQLQGTTAAGRPDFLLVVDFGYIVPNWLLALPQVAPINIHPSTLPRWRGSSPGQFVLLYGEKESSVSVIVMNELLDQGAIVAQLPFSVAQTWTQTEYYQAGFNLIAQQLPQILSDLAEGVITPQPQPLDTPTPIAGRFSKEDGFVPWELVQTALGGGTLTDAGVAEVLALTPLSPILAAALQHHQSLAAFVYHASHALAPWPGLWTLVQTAKGEKRMKILQTSLAEASRNSIEGSTTASQTSGPQKLILETVQLEGKEPTDWNAVRNSITE